MKKRNITWICIALLIMNISGCAGGNEPGSATDDQNEIISSEEDSSMPETEPAESAPQPETAAEPEKQDEDPAESSEPALEFKREAGIEQKIIYDEDNIVITAVDLTYTGYSADLSLLFENNSSDDISFISGSIGHSINSVNGYMIDTYLNTEVTAGNKTNETLSISIDELLLLGITEIADIQLSFQMDHGDYDYTYTGLCNIETSAAGSYDHTADSFKNALNSSVFESLGAKLIYKSEEEIYHNNDVRISAEAIITNRDDEQLFLYEIVNETEKTIDASTSNININGLTLSSGTWSRETIAPGCRLVDSIILDNLADENVRALFGIEEIGQLSFDFSICDEDDNELNETENLIIHVADTAHPYDTSGAELYNEDGIRIVSKGLADDSFSLSDDVHWILFVENNSEKSIYIDEKHNSLSVNGFMTNEITSSLNLQPQQSGILDVEMQSYSLEKNNISGIDSIESAEIIFEIKDDRYHDIASAKVGETFVE